MENQQQTSSTKNRSDTPIINKSSLGLAKYQTENPFESASLSPPNNQFFLSAQDCNKEFVDEAIPFGYNRLRQSDDVLRQKSHHLNQNQDKLNQQSKLVQDAGNPNQSQLSMRKRSTIEHKSLMSSNNDKIRHGSEDYGGNKLDDANLSRLLDGLSEISRREINYQNLPEKFQEMPVSPREVSQGDSLLKHKLSPETPNYLTKRHPIYSSNLQATPLSPNKRHNRSQYCQEVQEQAHESNNSDSQANTNSFQLNQELSVAQESRRRRKQDTRSNEKPETDDPGMTSNQFEPILRLGEEASSLMSSGGQDNEFRTPTESVHTTGGLPNRHKRSANRDERLSFSESELNLNQLQSDSDSQKSYSNQVKSLRKGIRVKIGSKGSGSSSSGSQKSGKQQYDRHQGVASSRRHSSRHQQQEQQSQIDLRNNNSFSSGGSNKSTPMWLGSNSKSRDRHENNQNGGLITNQQEQRMIEGQKKEFYHPFAQAPTPYEKMWEIGNEMRDRVFFMLYDNISFIIEKIWSCIVALVSIPVSIVVVIFDKICQLFKKCPRKGPCFKNQSPDGSAETQDRKSMSRRIVNKFRTSKKKLLVVLDLDQTLIQNTMQKPLNDDQSRCITVENPHYGGQNYVHMRPHLLEFLQKLKKLDTIVSIFSTNQPKYVDPILDKLDPDHSLIKYRFYNDQCIKGGTEDADFHTLKDMSTLESLLQEAGTKLATNTQKSPWWKFGFGSPINSGGTYVNILSHDIQISRELLKQLIIVDKSTITYNAYKNNTIRVSQWSKDMATDRILIDCLEIIEQLLSNPKMDVAKDLQYIIDIKAKYKMD